MFSEGLSKNEDGKDDLPFPAHGQSSQWHIYDFKKGGRIFAGP